MKTLQQWCQEEGISYHTGYARFKAGRIPEAFRDPETKRILVGKKTTAFTVPAKSDATISLEPIGIEEAFGSTKTRSNRAATIKRTDRFKHIDESIHPFQNLGTRVGYGSPDVSLHDAIVLTQKAYYNFAIFRNTIDLMTEFSVNNIYFKNGSKKVRDFFEAYFKKINLWAFQDKFFREYFRSGNVFIYRFEGEMNGADVAKITQTFGEVLPTSKKIPIRYVILNPADITVGGNITFVDPEYYKTLTDYELERLRNPKTDEDKEVFNSLPPDVKELIQKDRTTQVQVLLSKENMVAVFYKKQDYEPLAIPLGYSVLEDINFKSELRNLDAAVSRTINQAILLVTMGAELKDGKVYLDKKQLEAMQSIFLNESVGRVLIADWTTKAEFIIPDIAGILDPKKYEQIDKDIQIGLNNVLVGSGEKFANQHAKIEVFVERLKHARQAFLNEFLIPEIKRIAKNLGFKNYPEPFFEEIDLKNDVEYSKIYTQLLQYGVLTPEETIEAINTGKLPTSEESVESQQKFKDLKDKGLYEPLLGKPKNEEGRPNGTKAPQSTKKISPIGASYSLSKIKDNLILSAKLQKTVESVLLKKFKLKKLDAAQQQVAEQITETIMCNETADHWMETVGTYITEPVDRNAEMVKNITNISAEHQVNNYLGAILFHSLK